MSLRLGIDTGGTYTDAVLVDVHQQIVATAKCLTTRHDLTLGIANTLRELPQETLRGVEMVALSTTLSTNSVVEGRGGPVGVLLPGYRDQQVQKSGLLKVFEPGMVITLSGGHDASGNELQALDEKAAGVAILALADKVSTFAISSMFGVRNPAHEVRLRKLVLDLCAKPVTCGHELATDLDAPRRALTVALNARMVPIIHELIMAVQKIMRLMEIQAPLMMVKGNGSLVNTETALRQPVGTVLSGPAASVVGACALTGAGNAIIADMGGTTTDIAVVTDGQAALGDDGVRIGDWKPMVEAVRVISVGLGGDSEVRFSVGTGIEIGPRRVVPLSLLAHQFPAVLDALRQQLNKAPSRRNNLFALQLEHNELLLSGCSAAEFKAWELLNGQAVELDSIVETDRETARAISRLQRLGLVVYSGFTPSDAAHVLGLSTHWNLEAANLAALLWARQMRHIYGLGRWQEGDALTPSQHVFERVNQRISQVMIEAGLHHHNKLDRSAVGGLTGMLAELIYESGDAAGSTVETGSLFQLGFAADHPVVAVGAPAAAFFPDAAKRLGAKLALPEHAAVANAYGAVMGSVIQRSHVTVTQPLNGQFIVHSNREPIHFDKLEEAVETARELATKQAQALATEAGAGIIEIKLDSDEKHIQHDVDGDLFLETRITATATGRPPIQDVLSRVDSPTKRACGHD